MNTDKYNGTAAIPTEDPPQSQQDLHHHLKLMIEKKDWDGIRRRLIQHEQRQQQEQHTADPNKNTNEKENNTPEEMVNILTSNNKLPYTLLMDMKEGDSGEQAKTLFFMLITLGGGKHYVMREDFYLGKEYEEYGALLHVAIRCKSSMEVMEEVIEVGGGRDFVWERYVEDYTTLHYA